MATQEYYDTCGYQTARYENVITGLKLFSQRIIPVNIYMPADSLNHPSDKAYTLMAEEGGIPNSTVGMQYHSYVTLPVTWKVTNTITDTVLFSDMESTLDYSWILSSNVTSGVNAGDTLIVEIVDAHGCPVHATTIVYKPELGGGIASYYRNYDWATTTQDFKEYCPAGFYNGTRKRFENLLGETRFWSTSSDENSENTPFFSMTFPCHKLGKKEDTDNFSYSIRCILEE